MRSRKKCIKRRHLNVVEPFYKLKALNKAIAFGKRCCVKRQGKLFTKIKESQKRKIEKLSEKMCRVGRKTAI